MAQEKVSINEEDAPALRRKEALKQKKPPGVLSILLCLGGCLVGVAIFLLGIYGQFYFTVSENDLTLVEGIPADIDVSRVPRRFASPARILHFRIGNVVTAYGEGRNFDEIERAVRSGEPIRIWVWMARPAKFGRVGEVPLYQVEQGKHLLLSFKESEGRDQERNMAPFFISVVVLIASGSALALTLYKRRKMKRLS